MSKIIFLFFVILFGIGVYLLGQEYVLLPSDILFTFPQYQEEYGFQTPQNSLISDPVVQFEPWRVYAKQRIQSFELPLINDQSSLGSPFLANPQTSIFFPLSLFYLLFSPGPALFYIGIFKLLCIFLFSYIYFRSIEVKKNLSLFGAFFISNSAFFLMWLSWPHTNVFLFFPLILFTIEKLRVAVSRYRHRYVLMLSICIFLATLGGHPETLFNIGIISGLYLLVRLWGRWRVIFLATVFFFLGFLLASFQLIPFLEYLSQSYMLVVRQSTNHTTSLPLLGGIFLILPHLAGGPHIEFYKPVLQGTNFQELLGGYVGVTLFITGITSTFKIRKSSLSLFWIALLIISFGVSYGVFPFTLLESMPIYNLSAHQRFSWFFSFSLIVLTIIYINELVKEKKVLEIKNKPFIFIAVFLISSSLLLLIFPFEAIFTNALYQDFVVFLKQHIFSITISFVLSCIFLYRYIFSKKTLYLVLFALAILPQTLLLFGQYNTLLPLRMYYPKTELTETLSRLPSGTYIEVGNNAIPENVNMAYGLSNIENYDALEIQDFKLHFDDTFPIKNQWGNVDEVTYAGLVEFGIAYIVSDYDVRETKKDIYSKKNEVLSKINMGSPLVFRFHYAKPISGIRLLPATFNRENDCQFSIEITDEAKSMLFTDRIKCSQFSNNHFYTIPTPSILSQSGNYYVTISLDSTYVNTASFFGSKNTPYFAVLSPETNSDRYNLLARGETWYLFEVLNFRKVVTNGTIESLHFAPESISFVHTSESDETVIVRRAKFPGWEVSIDNHDRRLLDSSFLKLEVPKGEHFVKFSYIPYAFYVGAIISMSTFCGLVIYFLRKELLYGSFYKRNLKQISQKMQLTPWYKHIEIVFVSFVLSTTLVVLFFHFVEISFLMPDTTVINWITINNYPKAQDYLGFVVLFPIVLVLTILFWLVWIFRKKHF